MEKEVIPIILADKAHDVSATFENNQLTFSRIEHGRNRKTEPIADRHDAFELCRLATDDFYANVGAIQAAFTRPRHSRTSSLTIYDGPKQNQEARRSSLPLTAKRQLGLDSRLSLIDVPSPSKPSRTPSTKDRRALNIAVFAAKATAFLESIGSPFKDTPSEYVDDALDLLTDSWNSLSHHQRMFREGNVYIDGRGMAIEPDHGSARDRFHCYDLLSLLELHFAWSHQDRVVRLLFANESPKLVLSAMQSLLLSRRERKFDNTFIARINASHRPEDIVGWMSCSIIRRKEASLGSLNDSDLRALDWNLATAVKLIRDCAEPYSFTDRGAYKSGIGYGRSQGYWDSDFTPYQTRDNLVETAHTGVKRMQAMEFSGEDFLVITNLAVHPDYPAFRNVISQLVEEAKKISRKTKLRIFMMTVEDLAEILIGDFGFVEAGCHVHFEFEPEYKWIYVVWSPWGQRTSGAKGRKLRKARVATWPLLF